MVQLGLDEFSLFVGFLSGIGSVIVIVTVGIAYFELKNRKNKE